MSKHHVSARLLAIFCFSGIFALGATAQTQAGGQLIIKNQSNKVYSGLNITTAAGSGKDCIQIIDSSNITIESSQIGPCGGNGIDIFTDTSSVSEV